ncbi:MAG TPA: hypothetical protein VEA99_10940, partial [Gemmatimonadaceae bacterium]|nr:hypothetical protein [Gemmatimonadaceae bacterium]
ETNIVMIDLPPGIASSALVARAAEADVLLAAWSPTRVRAVTHLDVSADAADRAAAVVADALAALERGG